jgi:hypothetical protein
MLVKTARLLISLFSFEWRTNARNVAKEVMRIAFLRTKNVDFQLKSELAVEETLKGEIQ